MDLRSSVEHRFFGIVIGLLVTIVAAAVFHLGGFRRLDDFGLDLHLRHTHVVEADPRIVLIDIDDTSLEVVSEWPWPRRRMAQVVRSLSHAGAAVIVLDSVFVDPTAPRVEHAGLSADYDLDAGLIEYGDRSTDEIVYHDEELRRAIAEAGNVYLGMYGRVLPASPERLVGAPPDPAEAAAPSRDGGTADGSIPPMTVAIDVLRQDFSTDLDEAHAQPVAGASPEALARVWRDAKQHVARDAAERFVADRPAGSFPEFIAMMCTDSAVTRVGAERSILADAYRRARARSLLETIPAPAGSHELNWSRTVDETYPLPSFVEAARGVGWVAYGREAGNGFLRSMPMLVGGADGFYASLGMLVACDVLGLNLAEARVTPGFLHLVGGDDPRAVPLEADGETLIAWHQGRRRGSWRRSFDHLPAHRALRAAMIFEGIEENDRRIGLLLGELVAERHRETPAAYDDYAGRVNRWWRARRERLRALDVDAVASADSMFAWRDAQVAAAEQEALVWLRRAWGLWRDESPQTDEERRRRERIARLHRRIIEERAAEDLVALNAELADDARAALDALRAAVAGRICLVGNTASSVADLVATPVDASMPGVMAHANVVNMMLRNRFVRRAGEPWQLGLLIVVGVITTVLTNRRPPARSLVASALLCAGVALLGVLAFRSGGVYLATLPVAVSSVFVWTGVSVHREITRERSRRLVERALSQYTSPQIAGRIAQDSALRQLLPQSATVTCFFCDLEGFTGLSERLGPQATRDTLNPYLERMSAILVEHGAIVNKFIGDGIFAFFNAPICPCPAHEQAAAAAAWACRRSLDELSESLDLPGGQLRMRIGLATGEVFVGNYGSEAKLDYTCIGDRVNLAARLEKANKAFGTTILMDGPTRESIEGAWVVRELGRLRVPGRLGAVEAFELLGDQAGVTEAQVEHSDRLAEAIRRFQTCDWGTARESFEACGAVSPSDRVAAAYLDAIAQHTSVPPPDDWDGVIIVRFD